MANATIYTEKRQVNIQFFVVWLLYYTELCCVVVGGCGWLGF